MLLVNLILIEFYWEEIYIRVISKSYTSGGCYDGKDKSRINDDKNLTQAGPSIYKY